MMTIITLRELLLSWEVLSVDKNDQNSSFDGVGTVYRVEILKTF
jgi:hypothetical protein